MNKELNEVPFGHMKANKRNGVFVALTAQCQLYLNYNDSNMTEQYKQTYFPVVLMVDRWDGKIGFPGGIVDENETIRKAVIRELDEETGIQLSEDFLKEVCSHETERIIVHLFSYDYGKLTMEEIKNISSVFPKAKHYLSEGIPSWKHLADYGNKKGFQTLLNSNTLATAVKEELECLVASLNK